MIRRVCVFCGSSAGRNPIYMEAAERLGRTLAGEGIEVVYGGAHVGLMGMVADSALAAGGRVIGVIPQSMVAREIAHTGLTELRIVQTMHERKALMADLSDAFIAMPGAFGTLDEFCEILTWAQLRIHAKPCGLWNVAGYWDALLGMFDHAVAEGFMKPAHREMVIADGDLESLLGRLRAWAPGKTEKW